MNGMRIRARILVSIIATLVSSFGAACDAQDAVWPGDEPGYVEEGGGVIDKETLRTALRSVQPDFQACYVEAGEAQPGIQGRVVMGLSLDEFGARAVVLESDIDSEEMLSCLSDAMENGPFPVTSTRVEVKVPFIFRTR